MIRNARWLAWLAFIAVLSACSGDSPTQPPDDDTRGSIAGSIKTTDAQAVSGAKAELSGQGVEMAAFTNEAGAFQFDNLQPGTYTLEVRLPLGYEASGPATQTVQVRGGRSTATFTVRAIRTQQKEILPGQVDTLVVSSGAMLVIDANSALVAVTASLEEVPTSRSFDHLGERSMPVRLRVVPTSGSGSLSAGMALDASLAPGSAGFLNLKIVQKIKGLFVDDPGSFVFDAGPDLQPLLLWSDPSDLSKTTFADPNTGESGTVAIDLVEADAGQQISVLFTWVRVNYQDACGFRALEAQNGDVALPSGKKALILIHGWQPARNQCSLFSPTNWRPDGVEAFDSLVRFLGNLPPEYAHLSSIYKLYWIRYPTFEPVALTSDWLLNEVRARGLQGAVLIGHSMGGLVGRAMLAADDTDDIGGLITLGTPHEGTLLADLARDGELSAKLGVELALQPVTFGILPGNLILGAPILATPGVNDMSPDGPLVQNLIGKQGDAEKVFTFGSVTEVNVGSKEGLFYTLMAEVLKRIGAGPSDGMVPLSSAFPSWTTHQTEIANYNHSDLRRDPNGILFPQVLPILDVLGQCVPGPAPPTVNDFPISGAVARKDDRSVDVTLNPIVINGTPVTGLSAANFMIIEDGCMRPFEITTDQGSVGVDIAFAQDLSGSMQPAISGVVSSVLSFASDLEARGIDVLIGSVGYSGTGTIPSSPPTSACEFLGPVQDLTRPAPFQDHVIANWIASGGCDGPENALEAIEYGHNTLAWRAGAVRVYIDITDVSHHTATTNCNGFGPCTDQTLASIVNLVGSTSTIHAVAPTDPFFRTLDGGLDPWLLADRTGGQKLDIGSGFVDLTALGIVDAIAETVRLTFDSSSAIPARHRIRIRVEVNGCGGKCVAELSPGLVQYVELDPSLLQVRR